MLVHPSPSFSLSLVFFFETVRTFLVGKVGDGMLYIAYVGKRNLRLWRLCCGLSAGWVVRFVIVWDNASPLCSVLFLWNWVFQMICLFVKLDMFVWCRRIVFDLVFLEPMKFSGLYCFHWVCCSVPKSCEIGAMLCLWQFLLPFSREQFLFRTDP